MDETRTKRTATVAGLEAETPDKPRKKRSNASPAPAASKDQINLSELKEARMMQPAETRLPSSTSKWNDTVLTQFMSRKDRHLTLHREPTVVHVHQLFEHLAKVSLARAGDQVHGPYTLPIVLLKGNPANVAVLNEAQARDLKLRSKIALARPFGYSSEADSC